MTVLDDKATRLLATDAVRIIRRSADLVSARVRDRGGIYDVQLALDPGAPRADCTCSPATPGTAGACAHTLAVVRVTIQELTPEAPEPAVKAAQPPGWPRSFDFRPHDVDASGIIPAPTSLQWVGFQEDLKRIGDLKEAQGAAMPQESAELMYAAISGLCGGRPTLEEIAALPYGVAMEFIGQMIGAATALHRLPQKAGGA